MDMVQLDTLKMLVKAESDIARFADNEELLKYALSYAESEILKRCGTDTLEDKYQANIIEGAKWYLSRLGSEGAKSVSENGTSITWKDVPEWLESVVPRVGVVHSA